MKKITPILFSFLFLFSLTFGFMSYPVIGEDTGTTFKTIDWDEFTIGDTSGSGTFFSFARTTGDDFRIYNSYVTSSPYSLYLDAKPYVDNPDEGNILFDVPEISLLNISFNWNIYSRVSSHDGYMVEFYIYNGSILQGIVGFITGDVEVDANYPYAGMSGKSEDNINKIVILNYTTLTWDTIKTCGTGIISQDCSLTLESAMSGQGIKYGISVDGGISYAYATHQLIDATKRFGNFTKIFINMYPDPSASGGDGQSFNIDDINITHVSAPLPDTYEVTEWDYIGDLTPCGEYYTYSSSDIYLEQKRNVKMNFEIKAIDLMVSSSMYSGDSDLNNYYLSINGDSFISPVAFIPYCDYYVLRWYDVNRELSDEYLTLEFYHSELSGTHYWHVLRSYPSDGDNDGTAEFKHHSNSNKINGVYDGTILSGKDLAYRIYFPYGSQYNNPVEYNDVIDTEYNTYDIFDTVNIIATVSSLLYVNKLVIENDTTELYNQSFSTLTTSYSFIPTVDGNYKAHIYRNGGFVANCTFTVNDIDTDFFVYTVPNPSKPLQEFNIFLRYLYSDNPCGLLLYNYNAVNPIKSWVFSTVPFNQTLKYTINTEGIYYFDICYRTFDNYTGYTFNALARHKHVVKNERQNVISATYENIENTECNILYGTHNFLGQNIFIRINGEYYETLIDNPVFTIAYCPAYGGDYLAELVLQLSDEIIVLSNCTFTVSGDLLPEEKSDIENAFELIPDWAKGIGGCIITVGFILIPVFLVLQFKKSGSDFTFPPIVYAVFGGVGVTFSWIIGFFGFEIFFFIVFITSLVTVISYVWKERSD